MLPSPCGGRSPDACAFRALRALCDREATLGRTTTPLGLHVAHLWVVIRVTWATSSVSLHFPNPGLSSITPFSSCGMFTSGLTARIPDQTEQPRFPRFPHGSRRKGGPRSGGGDWRRGPALNRTRRVSPGTRAPGMPQASELHPSPPARAAPGARCQGPRAQGAQEATGRASRRRAAGGAAATAPQPAAPASAPPGSRAKTRSRARGAGGGRQGHQVQLLSTPPPGVPGQPGKIRHQG